MGVRSTLALVAALFFSASGHVARRHLPGGLRPSDYSRVVAFKHQLRVCNAYASTAALDVYKGDEKLTDHPMEYKACRDLRVKLRAGDRLQFRAVDMASMGTFSISDLPNNDAVLLLVIHRHDSESTAVAFESHVFEDAETSEVAVIDTYRGRDRNITAHISGGAPPKKAEGGVFFFLFRVHWPEFSSFWGKPKEEAKPEKTEDLRFQSTLALNPGVYTVSLNNWAGNATSTDELTAVRHKNYVIFRTGIESEEGGTNWPEEITVYPKPHAGAASQSVVLALLLAFFAALR